MTLKSLRAVLSEYKYTVRAHFAETDKTEIVTVDYHNGLDEFMAAANRVLDFEKMRAKVSDVRFNTADMQAEITVNIG